MRAPDRAALLDQYLDLEGRMLAIEDVDSVGADEIRNRLDGIWHALTPAERHALNARPALLSCVPRHAETRK